jgi:hypothetical protein
MKINLIIILASALAILPSSYGSSLGSNYELDASKKSKTLKGKYQETTEMQFTVDIKRKKLGKVNGNLTAELFVFTTMILTKEDVIQHIEIFENINLSDGNEFSAKSKKFNIIDKHGVNPTNVDKNIRGF